MDCLDTHEWLKYREQRQAALALAFSSPEWAEQAIKQGKIDFEDYKQAILHHLQQQPDQNAFDKALRQGIIDFPQYCRLQEKYYSVNAQRKIEGILEGVITDDFPPDQAGEVWDLDMENKNKRYAKEELMEELAQAYLDKIVLKPETDLVKATYALIKEMDSCPTSYQDFLNQRIRRLKRAGFIIPPETEKHNFELESFTDEFLHFMRSNHRRELTAAYKKIIREKKRRQKKEEKDLQKQRARIMQEIGVNSWEEVIELPDPVTGIIYCFKK